MQGQTFDGDPNHLSPQDFTPTWVEDRQSGYRTGVVVVVSDDGRLKLRFMCSPIPDGSLSYTARVVPFGAANRVKAD